MPFSIPVVHPSPDHNSLTSSESLESVNTFLNDVLRKGLSSSPRPLYEEKDASQNVVFEKPREKWLHPLWVYNTSIFF